MVLKPEGGDGGVLDFLMDLNAYARSDGFAIFNVEVDPMPESGLVGHVLDWKFEQWEIVDQLPMPCCGLAVFLVQKLGLKLETWTGIICPDCGQSFTFRRGTFSGDLS